MARTRGPNYKTGGNAQWLFYPNSNRALNTDGSQVRNVDLPITAADGVSQFTTYDTGDAHGNRVRHPVQNWNGDQPRENNNNCGTMLGSGEWISRACNSGISRKPALRGTTGDNQRRAWICAGLSVPAARAPGGPPPAIPPSPPPSAPPPSPPPFKYYEKCCSTPR